MQYKLRLLILLLALLAGCSPSLPHKFNIGDVIVYNNSTYGLIYDVYLSNSEWCYGLVGYDGIKWYEYENTIYNKKDDKILEVVAYFDWINGRAYRIGKTHDEYIQVDSKKDKDNKK